MDPHNSNNKETSTMKLSETLKIETVNEHLKEVPSFFKEILLSSQPSLSDELERLLFLKNKCSLNETSSLIHYRESGFSTYEWKGVAKIQFAPLLYGAGYIVKRSLITKTFNIASNTVIEQYSEEGKSTGTVTEPLPQILYVNLTEMEPECSVTSHLYNILNYEYEQAATGNANSTRILLLETLLKKSSKENSTPFSWFNTNDLSLENLQLKLLQNEIDPALTFKEKAVVRSKLKDERKQILKTKTRIHGNIKSKSKYTVTSDALIKLKGFKERPKEKSVGTLHKYTIGLLDWFFSVVKENIGYSVALAIYAPFTYYFITQPMNPGAMWAVGEVRKGFLSITSLVEYLTPGSKKDSQPLTLKEDVSTADSDQQPIQIPPIEINKVKSILKYDTSTAFEKAKPHYEGMLIGTDISSVNNQTWNDRMSNFKQLQISYESNLQFSQRMGRLEQMELQLNFAVIAESSYLEIEHYSKSIAQLKEVLIQKNLFNKAAKTYIENESSRMKQFKLYIWDKMVRYMLDHPYVVLNKAKDQSFVDYYLGRNFIFFEELTKDLSNEYKGFKKPKGYDAIEKLSAFYQSQKVAGNSIEDRIKKNSVLYKLSNPYHTEELRNALKRQWEILYLSYSRAQEPANFGLQLYVWSVRNAVWSMGALFTAKSREIEALIQYLKEDPKNKGNALTTFKSAQSKIEAQIESLFHILTLEYVSIREELNKKLDNDLDSTQRQHLIEGIEKSFSERTDFLLSLDMK